MSSNPENLPEITVDRSILKALKAFDADRFRWLDEAAALGPLAVLKMGPVKVFVLTDADAAREMLITNGSQWIRPPAAVIPIRIPIGDNLFTQSDEAWSLFQPEVAPQFRKRALDTRLTEIGALIDDEVAALPFDTPFDVELAMGRIALILAAWVLFGEHLARDRAEEIAFHQREMINWVGERLGQLRAVIPFAPRSGAMRAHANVIKRYADEVIERGKKRSELKGLDAERDVLDAMIHARPGGSALTHKSLQAHVLGMFLAGNETTAAALSWAVVQGANAPAEWERVAQKPSVQTNAFLDETMRLSPAVWGFARTPRRHSTLRVGETDNKVRYGTVVTVYTRAINRRADIWYDPLVFNPNRQLAATRTKEQERSVLTFGLGPRGCIGQRLALAEMQAILPRLAQHGRIEITQDVTEDPSFATRVRGGLKASIKPWARDQNKPR
jgi:cytochrome P450